MTHDEPLGGYALVLHMRDRLMRHFSPAEVQSLPLADLRELFAALPPEERHAD